jgi:hypothetical protein
MQTAPLYTENLTAAMYGSMPYKNTTQQNIAPKGYMTGEEFRRRAIEKVNTFCDKHGIL